MINKTQRNISISFTDARRSKPARLSNASNTALGVRGGGAAGKEGGWGGGKRVKVTPLTMIGTVSKGVACKI